MSAKQPEAQAASFEGLQVVDLGAGMASAIVVKHLREAGASVTRFEPEGGDPFYSVYPAYATWHEGSSIIRAASQAQQLETIRSADICIVGGEDFPDLQRSGAEDARAAGSESLIILDIEAYPSGTKLARLPACDILAQARSGLCNEHYSTRPLLFGFEPSAYGAALHGLCGLLTALLQREATARGQVVSTSLFEGALAWVMLLWTHASRPTPASSFVMPFDPHQLIFRFADDKYVQFVLGSAGSKYKIYRILGIDDPSVAPDDSGMPQPTADARNFFGDIDLLAAHTAKMPSDEFLKAVWAEGLPAEPVLPPGGAWRHPQVQHNGIIKQATDGTRFVGRPYALKRSASIAEPSPGGFAQALKGVRVVDFGTFVAGPYSSAVLADFGAEVIKVESIGGDPNRAIFRSYTAVARGKRCITIDMKTDEGRRIAQRLCVNADVVTSNFRPGVSARLGIDAPTLHAKKPDLIVLENAAYGATGPSARLAGFDMCFQALCGHDHKAGGEGNPPLWNRTSMVDFCGGLIGAIAILECLYARAQHGHGTEIHASLLNIGLFLQSELIEHPNGEFAGAGRLNHEQTGYHPAEQFYQAKDGWLAIAARDDAMASRLAGMLGLDKTITAPKSEWGAETGALIAQAIAGRSRDDLLNASELVDVWAAPCNDDGEREMLNDETLRRLGIVHASAHPQFGDVKQIGPLCRLESPIEAVKRPCPLPGEHTDEILRELGYSAAEIEHARARSIVA